MRRRRNIDTSIIIIGTLLFLFTPLIPFLLTRDGKFLQLIGIWHFLGALFGLYYFRKASSSSPTMTITAVKVPTFGEYLLYLFISKTNRDSLIGDLLEEYIEVYKKFGKTKANIWYYKQVFTSLYPLLRRFVIKWGLIGIIGKWVSKIIS